MACITLALSFAEQIFFNFNEVQFIFLFLFIYLFFCLLSFVAVVVATSWAAPEAYGDSQARG